jgi:cob(I)alamin adenosyltransferase
MHIYTKFGDFGETALLSGKKVSKANPRVQAYGSVDELNAFLGLIIAFADEENVRKPLLDAQKDLFTIGAQLSAANSSVKVHKISESRIDELEKEIDKIEEELPALHHFILPGGSKTASLIHLARTVCRRAEREVVALSNQEKIDPAVIIYLNRLGDYLFMLARQVNRRKRIEKVWSGHGKSNSTKLR